MRSTINQLTNLYTIVESEEIVKDAQSAVTDETKGMHAHMQICTSVCVCGVYVCMCACDVICVVCMCVCVRACVRVCVVCVLCE